MVDVEEAFVVVVREDVVFEDGGNRGSSVVELG